MASEAGIYRAAACDVICLGAVVLPGGKTMERSGAFIWQRKEIRLIFANQPGLVY